MRNIALLIEYDGTAYAGWQFQTNALSVQQIVEEQLAALCGHPVRVHGSGRTDSGVHAEGQVCTFETATDFPMSAFCLGLNTKLPPDIRILEAREMPENFHARLSAKRKCYVYRILTRGIGSALLRERAWHVSYALDWDLMDRSLALLVGRHDFLPFQSASADTTTSVREILSATHTSEGPLHELRFVGDGFLKRQVRSMVGTLVEIGAGKLPADRVEALLADPTRTDAGQTAPAQGLTLLWVDFGEGPWIAPGGPVSPVNPAT